MNKFFLIMVLFCGYARIAAMDELTGQLSADFDPSAMSFDPNYFNTFDQSATAVELHQDSGQPATGVVTQKGTSCVGPDCSSYDVTTPLAQEEIDQLLLYVPEELDKAAQMESIFRSWGPAIDPDELAAEFSALKMDLRRRAVELRKDPLAGVVASDTIVLGEFDPYHSPQFEVLPTEFPFVPFEVLPEAAELPLVPVEKNEAENEDEYEDFDRAANRVEDRAQHVERQKAKAQEQKEIRKSKGILKNPEVSREVVEARKRLKEIDQKHNEEFLEIRRRTGKAKDLQVKKELNEYAQAIADIQEMLSNIELLQAQLQDQVRIPTGPRVQVSEKPQVKYFERSDFERDLSEYFSSQDDV